MITFKELREDIDTKKLTSLVRAGLFDANKIPLLKRMLNKDVTRMSSQEKAAMEQLLDKLIDEVLGNQQIYSKVRSNLQKEKMDESLDEETPSFGKVKTINHEGKKVKVLQVHDRYYLDATTAKEVDDKKSTDWKGNPIKNSFRHVTDSPESYHKKNINEKYEVAGDLPTVLVLKRKAIRVFPDGQRVALYHNDKLDTFVSIPYTNIGKSTSVGVSSGLTVHEETIVEDTHHDMEITDEEKGWTSVSVRKKPKLQEHVLHTLKAIVANKQKMPIKFVDGRRLTVDHQTANKIIKIHGAVNDQNKEKLVGMMNKSKEHFMKVAAFAMKH